MENYPNALPPQAQDQQPGLEGQMMPEPVYIRANYKGSEKLQGKVAQRAVRGYFSG